MTRDLLIAQLKDHEGSGPKRNGRFMPYRDSKGILSIGWGRNLEANGLRAGEADLLLSNDLDDAIQECVRVLPWYRTLDTVRQAVVAELMFNMGWPTFRQFEKALGSMAEHDFVRASMELRNSQWYRDVKRRRGERLASVMETGQW